MLLSDLHNPKTASIFTTNDQSNKGEDNTFEEQGIITQSSYSILIDTFG